MGTVIGLLAVIVALLAGVLWQLTRLYDATRLGNTVRAKHLELLVARGHAVTTSAGRDLLRQRLVDRLKG